MEGGRHLEEEHGRGEESHEGDAGYGRDDLSLYLVGEDLGML